jgi:hypothetical protein
MDDHADFEWLKKYSTCFVIDSDDVQILKEPNEFYSLLKVGKICTFFTNFEFKFLKKFF